MLLLSYEFELCNRAPTYQEMHKEVGRADALSSKVSLFTLDRATSDPVSRFPPAVSIKYQYVQGEQRELFTESKSRSPVEFVAPAFKEIVMRDHRRVTANSIVCKPEPERIPWFLERFTSSRTQSYHGLKLVPMHRRIGA